MLLILGGEHSGRHAFFDTLGIARADCATVTDADARAFANEGVVPLLSVVCARFSTYRAVIATERGLGIIPRDADVRIAREENGRLNQALAAIADCVVLVVAGIGRVIKGNLSASLAARALYVAVVRHGATQATLERRYAGGGTDAPLCDEGRVQTQAARAAFTDFATRCAPAVREALLSPCVVCVSPLRRCTETAALLFPCAAQRVVEEFREFDFGIFENKTADELLGAPETRDAYQAFVAGAVRDGCDSTVRCPPSRTGAGESAAQFVERTARAFSRLVHEACGDARRGDGAANTVPRVIVIVAHGGTQMALFSRFCVLSQSAAAEGGASVRLSQAMAPSYHAWQTDCAGFRFGVLSVP